jgi:hypothetical protein
MYSLGIGSKANAIGPSNEDRRRWVRYAGSPDTSCRVTFGPQKASPAVQIESISVAGISLSTDGLIPLGKEVALELINRANQTCCMRQMRVLYVLRKDDGAFTVGGNFSSDLSEVELRGLLDK